MKSVALIFFLVVLTALVAAQNSSSRNKSPETPAAISPAVPQSSAPTLPQNDDAAPGAPEESSKAAHPGNKFTPLPSLNSPQQVGPSSPANAPADRAKPAKPDFDPDLLFLQMPSTPPMLHRA